MPLAPTRPPRPAAGIVACSAGKDLGPPAPALVECSPTLLSNLCPCLGRLLPARLPISREFLAGPCRARGVKIEIFVRVATGSFRAANFQWPTHPQRSPALPTSMNSRPHGTRVPATSIARRAPEICCAANVHWWAPPQESFVLPTFIGRRAPTGRPRCQLSLAVISRARWLPHPPGSEFSLVVVCPVCRT